VGMEEKKYEELNEEDLTVYVKINGI